jgi:hypothetical protein
VSGATGDPECTATEDPHDVVGYDTTGECSAPLSEGNCTIENNKIAYFNVNKDFQPDAPGESVTVHLECDGGTVTPDSDTASEGSAAAFTVSEYTGNPVCTATESDVPAPYYAGGSCSANLSVTSCTIVNSSSITPPPLPPLPVGGSARLLTTSEQDRSQMPAVAISIVLGGTLALSLVAALRRRRIE